MTRLLACTALVIVTASGCHRRRAECAKVVDSAIERAMQSKLGAEAGSGLSPAEHARLAGLMAGVTPGLKSAMTDACTDDGWARAELDCLRAATTARAVWDCDRFLTEAQRTSLTQRMAAAVGTGSAEDTDDGSAGSAGSAAR